MIHSLFYARKYFTQLGRNTQACTHAHIHEINLAYIIIYSDVEQLIMKNRFPLIKQSSVSNVLAIIKQSLQNLNNPGLTQSTHLTTIANSYLLRIFISLIKFNMH